MKPASLSLKVGQAVGRLLVFAINAAAREGSSCDAHRCGGSCCGARSRPAAVRVVIRDARRAVPRVVARPCKALGRAVSQFGPMARTDAKTSTHSLYIAQQRSHTYCY